MQKVLVLEDDPLLAQTLKQGLTAKRLAVTVVNDLRAFSLAVNREQFAVCVMDRLIGDRDSIELIPEVRELLPQARILLLTKKSAVLDRIEGLEAGADDYLAKPFSMAELRLRIRSFLSLYRVESETHGLSIGKLMFYPLQGVLQGPTGKVFLPRRETEILLCLVRAAGTVVSKRFLERTLWPETFEPNPSTIDVYVRRLRQKLGSFGGVLRTKRGFGYYLKLR